MSPREPDELRVLLMSPLEGRDPRSGDLVYTSALLEQPPPGVRYTTYADALASGAMTIRGRRPRRGGFSAVDAPILALRGVEKAARGRLMFREPFWYVSLAPGAFDLVHQHLFTLRQVGPRVPTVSSAGYPLSVPYGVQDGWSAARAARAERLDRAYARAVGAHTPGLWAPPADVLTVYSEHFRRHLMAAPAPARQAPVLVCGQGLADRPAGPGSGTTATTLGFVGRDFARKGGDIALAAFALLRRTRPDLRLLLVTRASHVDPRALPDGVELVADPPPDVVVSELMPRIDVLMLPTAADCGAPYGVIEALRAGVPVVTSQVPWLDERLHGPAVARVERSAGAVAAAVGALLDPAALAPARAAARALWQDEFSMPALHRRLRIAYDRALAGGTR